MMKVLKPGKLPASHNKKLVYEGTCGNCACVIQVDHETIEKRHGDRGFWCPTLNCNRDILVGNPREIDAT